MRIIRMIAGVLVLNVVVFGQATLEVPTSRPSEQEQQPSKTLSDSSQAKQKVVYQRPEVTLQRALKLMEAYIKKEKIDIAPYYLSAAQFIRPDPEKNAIKEPYWLLQWFKAGEMLPQDMHFMVTMDGKVSRVPSM